MKAILFSVAIFSSQVFAVAMPVSKPTNISYAQAFWGNSAVQGVLANVAEEAQMPLQSCTTEYISTGDMNSGEMSVRVACNNTTNEYAVLAEIKGSLYGDGKSEVKFYIESVKYDRAG